MKSEFNVVVASPDFSNCIQLAQRVGAYFYDRDKTQVHITVPVECSSNGFVKLPTARNIVDISVLTSVHTPPISKKLLVCDRRQPFGRELSDDGVKSIYNKLAEIDFDHIFEPTHHNSIEDYMPNILADLRLQGYFQ